MEKQKEGITKAGFLKPPKLNFGDMVALVSPSGPLRKADKESLEASIELLRSWGLKPVFRRMRGSTFPYLAATDEERFNQMRWALTTKEIRAIFAVRGGYGAMRILPHLRPGWLRDDPKILVGFSDFTALLLGLGARAKVVSLHGPTVVSMRPEFSDESDSFILRNILMENVPPGPLKGAPLREGVGQGPLLGGCLSLVTALLGSRFFPDLRGAILFLEDVNEPLYRIDRMLQQLKISGVLGKINGLALGHFPENKWFREYLAELVLDATGSKTPVVADLPFGHGLRNVPLPVGCWAKVDGVDGTLRILELPFC